MLNKVSPLETSSTQLSKGPQPLPTWKRRSTIFVLCFINLVNFIDRYTVSGVLTEVQQYYDIGDAWAGFIQTSFMITYMIFSPLFGYTGDRYNRKWQMVGAIFVWKIAIIGSTFVPRHLFWLFLLMRSIVGIGEACYGCISPTIISDMYTGNWRARVYMIYYLAIPFGVGLGYMLAQGVSNLTNEWQLGIRAVGLSGVICFILAIFLVFEPDRDPCDMAGGDSSTKPSSKLGSNSVAPTQDSGTDGYTPQREFKTTSYVEDVKYLLTNRTYMLVTLATSAALFMSGNLAWWGPTLIKYAQAHEMKLNSTVYLPKEVNSSNSVIFGALLVAGGIAGVLLGSTISNLMVTGWKCFKYIKTHRAPAVVCTASCLLAAPSLLAVIIIIPYHLTISYVFILTTTVFVAFTWALTVVITITVVIPSRRSSANSWQMTISHLIGDSGGPYILGWITDLFYHNSGVLEDHLHAYLKSFYLCVASLVIAGVLYAASALTIVRDMRKMEEDTKLTIMEDEGNNGKPKTVSSVPKIDSTDHHPHKRSADEVPTDPKEGEKPFVSPVVPAYLGGESKEALDHTQIETGSSTEDGTKKLNTGLVPSDTENEKDGSDDAHDLPVKQTQ